MRGFVDALGLRNVAVIAERAEVLGRDRAYRDQVDLVAARACAPLPVLVEYALPLLRVGGALVAWKAAMAADELRAGHAAAAELEGDLTIRPTGVPTLGDHQFVAIRKVGMTPDRYPRRPGQAVKRPLG